MAVFFLTPLLLSAHGMPTREASGAPAAFVWINSLTALASLLGAVALGALMGAQPGLKWLPVRDLRHALGVLPLIAEGTLLLSG